MFKCANILYLVQEIMDLLTKETQHSDHQHADGFVLVILSHGDEGNVMGIDEQIVKIAWIEVCLDGRFFSNLAGKPKLIAIQSCRGSKL